MKFFLSSLVVFCASFAMSIGATSFSYLAENVEAAHRSLTFLSLAFFLLGIAIAVMANTNSRGQLTIPNTLSGLICVLILIPQAGIVIGQFVNFTPSLEIMLEAKNSPGSRIFLSEGDYVLSGPIGERTLESLEESAATSSISTLLLTSEGGMLDTAVQIGEELHRQKTDVFVPEYCESACVIIALSGKNLFTSDGAFFGFHRGSALASNDSEYGRSIANSATDQYLMTLRDLGVPESILAIARNTPATAMHYVSGREMIRLGLARHVSEYRE